MSAARFVVLALLMVPVLLASASAQAEVQQPRLTVIVVDPGEDLVATRPTTLEVIVRYAYPPGSVSQEPVPVDLEVTEAPPWAAAALDPARLLMPVNATNVVLGGSTEQRALVNLTLDPSAPARERQAFVVTGTAHPSGNLAGASAVSPEIGLQAAYVGKLNVTAPESLRIPGGRPAAVTFTITNEGNGETPVAFNVPVRPKNSQVEPPAAITLGRGESTEVTVTLRTPWTANENGILTLEATPERAGRDAKTFDATIAIAGTAVVPDAGALAFVSVAGAAVALARRRHA